MADWQGSQLNRAKEILAWELTSLVHGQEEADKAQAAAKALFGGGGDRDSMPTTELDGGSFSDGEIGILNLLTACGLAASRGEARRLVQQGGVSVNDEKISDIDRTFERALFQGEGVIIKKGKKVFHRAVMD